MVVFLASVGEQPEGEIVLGSSGDRELVDPVAADGLGENIESSLILLDNDVCVVGVASSGHGAYIPMTLAGIGIVLRGSAFAFRKWAPTIAGKRALGVSFAGASVLTPFFLGTVAEASPREGFHWGMPPVTHGPPG